MFRALFSLEGRLNRAPFWGYSILLTVLFLLVAVVVVVSILMPALAELMSGGNKPTQTQFLQFMSTIVPKFFWVSVVLQIVLDYPVAALCIKRRHDRNSSGLDVWIYLALSWVYTLLQVFGIGMGTTQTQGLVVPAPSVPVQAAGIALFAFAVYLFIVLALLAGTKGDNRYGPDPLLQ